MPHHIIRSLEFDRSDHEIAALRAKPTLPADVGWPKGVPLLAGDLEVDNGRGRPSDGGPIDVGALGSLGPVSRQAAPTPHRFRLGLAIGGGTLAGAFIAAAFWMKSPLEPGSAAPNPNPANAPPAVAANLPIERTEPARADSAANVEIRPIPPVDPEARSTSIDLDEPEAPPAAAASSSHPTTTRPTAARRRVSNPPLRLVRPRGVAPKKDNP